MLETTDWGELEDHLRTVTDGDREFDAYMKSPRFREILESDDEWLWNEMAAEAAHPFVAIGGFYCIRRNRPKQALAAGVRLLADRQGTSLLFYSPIFRMANDREFEDADSTTLDGVLGWGGYPANDLILALALIPAPVAASWLRSEGARRAPASSVALVLAHVLSDNRKLLSTAESERFLRKLAPCPGWPRLIYAENVDAKDANYRTVFLGLMKDKSVEDGSIYCLLINQRRFVEDNLDWIKTRIPAERMRLVDRALQHWNSVERSKESHRTN
jgi:hypothetical protein